MKILIWASFLHPHIGGYEKNILELSKRLVARHHQVDIITCRTDKTSADVEAIDGVKIVRIPCVRLLGGTYPVPLPSPILSYLMLSKCEYDVTVTQTRFFPLSHIGAQYSVMHKIPLIHVERGSQHSSVTNPVVNVLSKICDHTIGRWIVNRADKSGIVIGVSTAACEFAKHIGAKRIVKIPNGVISPMLPKIAGNGNGVPTILYVGRLVWAKGVQDLIAALDALKWGRGLFNLAIVGDGPYRKRLEDMADGRRDIKFYGEITGDTLNRMYTYARVFVNPSYSEGLPTAVIEAATLGIPVIATDVGGTSEIIEDGVTGTLIKPRDVDSLADKLYKILGNPTKALEMADECQKKVLKEYSWDKITDQYCEILNRITNNNQ